jgi:small conductance mechanosensitive channel
MTAGGTNELTGGATNEIKMKFEDVVNTHTWHGALLYAIIIALVAWLAGRALNLAIHRVLNRPKHIPADPTAIKFLGQLAQVGVYVFAILSYSRLIPALQGVGTAWLASVGAISVVIGLAAQNTLGNLIAGISLLLYRPFSLGDLVQVAAPAGPETGVVESLNLGYTVLRTPDHRRVVIPNSTMASQTSINLSRAGGRILCLVPFTFAYDADLDKARAILTELAKKNPKLLEFDSCPVTALGGGIVSMTLRIWCADFHDAMQLKSDLLAAAKKQFKAEGIELR